MSRLKERKGWRLLAKLKFLKKLSWLCWNWKRKFYDYIHCIEYPLWKLGRELCLYPYIKMKIGGVGGVLAFFSLIVPMLCNKRRYMIYHPTLLLIYGCSWGQLSLFCESKIWLDDCPALLLVKPWLHMVWFHLGFGFLSCDTLHLTSNQSEWEAEVVVHLPAIAERVLLNSACQL